MREILFRGKRVDNGEWIEGSLARWRDYYYIAESTCEEVSTQGTEYEPKWLGGWYRVDYDTIGQSTGLLDVNGNKIFERQYIYHDGEGWGVIIMSDGCFEIHFKDWYPLLNEYDYSDVEVHDEVQP